MSEKIQNLVKPAYFLHNDLAGGDRRYVEYKSIFETNTLEIFLCRETIKDAVVVLWLGGST